MHSLQEGQDLKQVVRVFAQKNFVKESFVEVLEKALRAKVRDPVPLQLQLGVVTPLGHRVILAIPEHTNSTIETSVFCARHGAVAPALIAAVQTSGSSEAATATAAEPINSPWCAALRERVEARLNVTFPRRILLVLPIDAPDGRNLKLVIREGEQHDIVQFVTDFFEIYHMPRESIGIIVQEVNKRLPAVALQIPVGLSNQRQVVARFSISDNITSVVAGFKNTFEIDDSVALAITKRALYGMAPGTFMV